MSITQRSVESRPGTLLKLDKAGLFSWAWRFRPGGRGKGGPGASFSFTARLAATD